MKEFDEEYFNKCYRLQCAGWQLFEYFYNKGYFSNKLFYITKFAEYFWNNPDSLMCVGNNLPWRWQYTVDGHICNEEEMRALVEKFV